MIDLPDAAFTAPQRHTGNDGPCDPSQIVRMWFDTRSPATCQASRARWTQGGKTPVKQWAALSWDAAQVSAWYETRRQSQQDQLRDMIRQEVAAAMKGVKA